MRKLLLSAVFASLIGSASAASITFEITSPAGDYTKTYTIPDGHMTRFFQAVTVPYTYAVLTGGVDANGIPNGRPPTREEKLTRLFDTLMRGWRSAVLAAEQEAAAVTARGTVAPITVPTIDTTP